MSHRIWWIALFVVALLVLPSPVFAQAKVEKLCSFEPGEKMPSEVNGEVAREHATDGEHSFRIVNPGQGYTGVRFTDREVLKKFADYVLLKVDIYNPQDRLVRYALRVDDSKSTDYGTRYNDENFVAPPGRSMLELNITSLLRSSSKNFSARDKLDTSALTLVNVFMGPQKEETVLYVDNIRLESSGLPVVEGLRAFDFGPSKAAVYPGFEGVNEKMPYDADRGFGWDKAQTWDRVYTPDDLANDFLRGGRFVMDLPNGDYELQLCVDPFGAWHRYPSFQWRKIEVNGDVVAADRMTADDFLAKYYLHEDDEDLPGVDVWETYVRTRNVIRNFPAKVTDGKLTVSVDSDDKYGKSVLFLIVYPMSKQAEGREWMKTLDAIRKERFNRGLYVVIPERDNPAPAATEEDRKRTFIPFVRHTELDMAVTACPTDAERKAPLAIVAAQGEREHAQLGLYPVGQALPVQVKVSDLKNAGGATIPSSAVRVRFVRNFLKHMGRARAGTILPYMLMDLQQGDTVPMKAGVTRGLWFTVQVPVDAAPGEYTGTVRLAPVNPPANPTTSPTEPGAVPIRVTVLPFALEPAKEMTLSVTGARAGHWRGYYPELDARWWKVAEAVMKDLADHGMNAVTGGPGAKIRSIANGKADIDFTDMDRWLALAVKYGLTMPGDSYQGLDVNGISCNSKDLAANEKWAQSNYGMSYPEVIKAVFAEVEKHAKEANWPRRSYYLLDEPRPEFGNIESALELTKIWVTAAPNTLFSGYYTTGSGRDPYFEVMPINISHYSADAAAITKKSGKALWDYDGSRVRHNIGRWAFKAHLNGLGGYLRNGYMYVNSDPYFDFSDDEASWCVVYPSKKDTVNATVGWERTAQGTNDYRYLEMLGRLIRSARDANKAKAEADDAQAYLDKTLAPIELTDRESAKLAPADYDAFKQALAGHIVALKKALE